MRSRAGLAVGVACLVVLAGCGAFVGGSSQPDVETVTPAPVPTDREASAANETETTAPPWLSSGVGSAVTVNVTALVRAHKAALANRSYSWTFRHRVTRDDATLLTRAGQVHAGTDALLVRGTTTGLGTNYSIYVTDGVGYLRTDQTSDASLQRLSQPRDRRTYTALSGEMIQRFMTNVSFTVAVVERDGQTYYRLHAANSAPPRSLVMATRKVWNYTATAYVTPEGFVRTLVTDYDYLQTSVAGYDSQSSLLERFEAQTHMSFRYTYAAVGSTSVERPTWVSEVTPSATGTPTTTKTPTTTGVSTATGTPTTTRTPTAAGTPATANSSTERQ